MGVIYMCSKFVSELIKPLMLEICTGPNRDIKKYVCMSSIC